MSQSLSSIRELLIRYRRANGSGSIKVANAMLPDMIELLIDYVDEATGRKPAEESDIEADLAYFAEKLRRCEAVGGAGSPDCAKARAQLTALEDAVIVQRAARAPERKTFFVDTGRLPPEDAKTFLTEAMAEFSRSPSTDPVNQQSMAVDMSALSDDDQSAYIEAQFRHQGIVNNGARYTGEEERVEHFLTGLKTSPAAPVCAPCEVKDDGSSDIVNALIGNQQIAALVEGAQANADIAQAVAPAPKKAPAKRAPAKKATKK